MQLSHIVAATDFSDTAGRAVERAALLARGCGAGLHLLHVIPAISWQAFGRALVEHPLITEKHVYEAARRHLQGIADDCRVRHGIAVDDYVEIGRASERIAAYAHRRQANLIVLGPHDEHFARDMFVGSTARKLLYADARPILIARTASEPYRRILAAVDFSEESKHALRMSLALAPQAETWAVHVYEILFEGKARYAGIAQDVIEHYRMAAEVEARLRMRDLLDQMRAGPRLRSVVKSGHPGPALLEEARTMDADLLVLGRRSPQEPGEPLLGDVTEHMLYTLDRDLLLI